MRRYKLLEPIGKGAMGTVYRALDRVTGHLVALKRVEAVGMEELEFREALAHEFQTLAGLRHPNIVSVNSFGFDEHQQPYFTMALLPETQTLLAAAAGRGFFGKLDLIVQTLQALAYLHRQGVVHQDVKPGNVLVDADGHVHVLDFGLATTASSTRADVMGTVLYMSPEVLNGGGSTRASDLFAVGVMLYEIMTGQHPFEAATVPEAANRITRGTYNRERLERALLAHLETADFEPTMVLRPAESSGPTPHHMSPSERAAAFFKIATRLLNPLPSARNLDANDVIFMMCTVLDIAPPAESDAIRSGFLRGARFVGRHEALNAIDNALTQTQQTKEGQVWLVSGESGIGKTRFVDEVRIRALVRGMHVAYASAAENEARHFQLSGDFLPELLLNVEITPQEAADFALLVPNLHNIVPFDFRPSDNTLPAAIPRLQARILSLCRRIRVPTLLVLDNLQWMGPESMLVREITGLAKTVPLVVVGTYRSDEAPYLYGNLHYAEHIELTRFTRDELAQVAAAMLGPAGQTQAVLDVLERESEGNITFAIDILQELSDQSSRLDDLDPRRLPREIYTQGIIDIATRRVRRLPLDYQPLMRLAAVNGRDIDFDLLAYYDPVINMSEWINAGMNAAVLTNADGRWQFAHDKLREGILHGLMIEERRRLHRMVADARLALYTNDANQLPIIAVHFAEANDWDMARQFAFKAAHWLMRNQRIDEAVTLIERLLELIPEEMPRERLTLMTALADTLLGRAFDRRIEIYEAALKLATTMQEHVVESQVRLALGRLYAEMGRLEQAQAQSNALLKITRSSSDLNLTAGNLELMGTIALRRRDLKEAQRSYEMALNLHRAAGHAMGVAREQLLLARIAVALNDLPAAVELLDAALPVLEATPDPRMRVRMLPIVFTVHYRRNSFAEANQVAAECVDNAKSVGDLLMVARGKVLRGWAAMRMGDLEAAVNDMAGVLMDDSLRHVPSLRFIGGMMLPIALCVSGRYDQALSFCRDLFHWLNSGDVQPFQYYRLYMVMGLACVLGFTGERSLSYSALGATRHSQYADYNVQHDLEYVCAQLDIDDPQQLPKDLRPDEVLAALRRRYNL